MALQRISTSSFSKMFLLIHDGYPDKIGTCLVICRANQWTGFYMIATFVMKELRYVKMITWLLFPNILIEGKLFVLFKRRCLWKINIFCYIGKKPLREGITVKNCKDLGGFFLEDWCKWILLSFALRYHSREQIWLNVATKTLWPIFVDGLQLPQG